MRTPDGRWRLETARRWQEALAGAVERRDRSGTVRTIAGVDVSYDRFDPTVYASVVVMDAVGLQVLETADRVDRARFPYIPGFLAFREAPPILAALAGLRRRPDLLLVDGHGWAHPRRAGIACHLGVVLDLPAIGVAKSILVGHASKPAVRRGSRSPLVHQGRRIGTALRTRDGVAPVFVSVGHRVSLATAERRVLDAGAGYRLPEPIRLAHLRVNALRRGER